MVRSQMFNLHSIRSVVIAKLKQKVVKIETCKYKIDKSSDGTLMPIRMYKMFFPHTNINELKTPLTKNSVACL